MEEKKCRKCRLYIFGNRGLPETATFYFASRCFLFWPVVCSLHQRAEGIAIDCEISSYPENLVEDADKWPRVWKDVEQNKSLQLTPGRLSGSTHAIPNSMFVLFDTAAQLNSVLGSPRPHIRLDGYQ